MKRLILVFVLTLSTGCATLRSLAQEIRDNPAAAISFGINAINTAVIAAQAGYGVWSSLNPTAAQGNRATFDSLLANIARGVRVAQDGSDLITASNASERLSSARSAMSDLHAFLAGLSGNGAGNAMGPEMQEALVSTAQASRP